MYWYYFRPFWKIILRLEYNIKVTLDETGCDDVAWIELAQSKGQWRAAVNEHINVPSGLIQADNSLAR
jgi:hypothetical protein